MPLPLRRQPFGGKFFVLLHPHFPHGLRQLTPLGRQRLIALFSAAGKAVIFPSGTGRGLSLIDFRKAVLFQAPKQGVDRAFIDVREYRVDAGQHLVTVLILRLQQMQQAQLDQLLFQHKPAPAAARPAKAVSAARIR